MDAWNGGAIAARVPLLVTLGGASSDATVLVNANGGVVGCGIFTVVRGILYFAERGGDSVLRRMNPDGTDATDIASGMGAWTCASWSPDGTRIAFESRRDGEYRIYAMNADGTNQTTMTRESSGYPVWLEPRWAAVHP
ncbi:MAG: hypothetical protein ABFD77_11215 [Thermotogota bacterium]